MQNYTAKIPLGISRTRKEEEINALQTVLGDFEFIDFNLSRTSENAFSLRITRKGVPNAQYGRMEIDEVVGGLIGDPLRLTYGEQVAFLKIENDIVHVHMCSKRK